MQDRTVRGTEIETPPERDLAGALHEVSNALTVMLGWIESARATAGDGTETSRSLDIAAAQARHATTMIRRAIGASVPADAPAPIDDVIAAAVLGLAPEARRVHVALGTEIAPSVRGALVGDGSTIIQVLTNLLLNAIAASGAGATVNVEAHQEGDGRLAVAVRDEGPGVPAERRATIFTAGRSTKPGGAGIGLRHAWAIARAAGGDLALADAEGGASFELRWPCQLVARVPAAPKSFSEVLAGARILLIEDDDAVIELLDMALTVRGASVVSIKRRHDLPEALSSGIFDAALFDLSPIEDDFAGALLAVREASPGARLIVISGSGKVLPELPTGCEAAWVRKPFEVSEIIRAVCGC